VERYDRPSLTISPKSDGPRLGGMIKKVSDRWRISRMRPPGDMRQGRSSFLSFHCY